MAIGRNTEALPPNQATPGGEGATVPQGEMPSGSAVPPIHEVPGISKSEAINNALAKPGAETLHFDAEGIPDIVSVPRGLNRRGLIKGFAAGAVGALASGLGFFGATRAVENVNRNSAKPVGTPIAQGNSTRPTSETRQDLATAREQDVLTFGWGVEYARVLIPNNTKIEPQYDGYSVEPLSFIQCLRSTTSASADIDANDPSVLKLPVFPLRGASLRITDIGTETYTEKAVGIQSADRYPNEGDISPSSNIPPVILEHPLPDLATKKSLADEGQQLNNFGANFEMIGIHDSDQSYKVNNLTDPQKHVALVPKEFALAQQLGPEHSVAHMQIVFEGMSHVLARSSDALRYAGNELAAFQDIMDSIKLIGKEHVNTQPSRGSETAPTPNAGAALNLFELDGYGINLLDKYPIDPEDGNYDALVKLRDMTVILRHLRPQFDQQYATLGNDERAIADQVLSGYLPTMRAINPIQTDRYISNAQTLMPKNQS